jgi:predicted 3-demethylubiquinone-9 3-methyltransferase (glyoxalase superfamily)
MKTMPKTPRASTPKPFRKAASAPSTVRRATIPGDALTVEFTVAGVPCIGLKGGPRFKHSEAFSFQIATDDQEETDRYWNAIVGNGGQESQCGWCKDK